MRLQIRTSQTSTQSIKPTPSSTSLSNYCNMQPQGASFATPWAPPQTPLHQKRHIYNTQPSQRPTPTPTPLQRRAPRPNLPPVAKAATEQYDAIIIGSGIGGLCCGAALTAYGQRPLILESHYAPGGVAHGFQVNTRSGKFHFDTGPSFFCGLSEKRSLNPLKHALDAVDEQVACVSYDRFYIDNVQKGSIGIGADEEETLRQVGKLAGHNAAAELKRFYKEMRRMHRWMNVPAVALRGDWKLGLVVGPRWGGSLLGLLPYVGELSQPVSKVMKRLGMRNGFVKQLIDTECFLLSGLKSEGTICAEVAFMIGERGKPGSMEYPAGGARAIVEALVRGIERKGGEVRMRAHVEDIVVRGGEATGVRLRGGEELRARQVISNASVWDTVGKLLGKADLPGGYRAKAMQTPAVASFMHAHMAVPAEGLEGLVGHHAVILDSGRDIREAGNVVMISVPSVWSAELAPAGWHVVHAYCLEEYERWPGLRKERAAYEAAKKRAAEPLLQAVRWVMPDLDARLGSDGAFVKIGTPVTHERFARRHRGTYGAAIVAGEETFEWPGDIPVRGLKRCGDSTFPGIGVPSSAAAGLIAANEMVGVRRHLELVQKVFPSR